MQSTVSEWIGKGGKTMAYEYLVSDNYPVDGRTYTGQNLDNGLHVSRREDAFRDLVRKYRTEFAALTIGKLECWNDGKLGTDSLYFSECQFLSGGCEMARVNINRGFKKLRVWQDAVSLYVLASDKISRKSHDLCFTCVLKYPIFHFSNIPSFLSRKRCFNTYSCRISETLNYLKAMGWDPPIR